MDPVDLTLLQDKPETEAVIYMQKSLPDVPQCRVLPALRYRNGMVLTEWQLTEEERKQIARGENIRVWVWLGPREVAIPPLNVEVTSEHRS